MSEKTLDIVFIARQAIFDRKNKIYGYELLFRSNAIENKTSNPAEMETSQVIADGFPLIVQDTRYKYFINFTSQGLLAKDFFSLPANGVVLEILEDIKPSEQILDVCLEAKNAGYLLALDDYIGEPERVPFLELVDFIKIDVLELKPKELVSLIRDLKILKNQKLYLIAEKVEVKEQLEFCKKLGFDFFQGFFFNKPQIIKGKKISVLETTKLEILQKLSDYEFDFKEIEQIIERDVNLAYKLMRYINSPFWGFRQKVSNIGRALVLLGEIQVKHWLQVTIMSDLATEDRKKELVYLAAFRGKFLQLLGKELGFERERQNDLFLIGSFSYLDALLDQPLEEILEHLALSSDIKAALLDKNHPDHKWIELVSRVEKGAWGQAEKFFKQTNISIKTVSQCINQAHQWAALLQN